MTEVTMTEVDELHRSVTIRADAAGMKARDAARPLVYEIRRFVDANGAPDYARQLTALQNVRDLLDEMFRWKDSWSHEHVDKDRKVREAMARSGDCEHHGEEIKGLSAQLHAIDESQRRTEAARLALLGWLHVARDYVDAITTRAATGGTLPSAEAVRDWMAEAIRKTSSAHDRAWRKPKTKGSADA